MGVCCGVQSQLTVDVEAIVEDGVIWSSDSLAKQTSQLLKYPTSMVSRTSVSSKESTKKRADHAKLYDHVYISNPITLASAGRAAHGKIRSYSTGLDLLVM